ncbi:MAG: hypothetical protein PWQ88_700 [Candidatus Methanomethylophilaceae archaeon]|nr:hypothetical protein [Candidatus Methanomethylophilaceae archaeon]
MCVLVMATLSLIQIEGVMYRPFHTASRVSDDILQSINL